MALIKWHSGFEVKIKQIDDQHQALVKMINDLDDAMAAGKSKQVLGGIINRLAGYATTHFATEERLFAKHGYPDAADHKSEHTKFLQQVGAFKAGFDAGTLGLSIQVMSFLSDWLQGHIKGSDQKYSPFLVGKGVS